MAISATAVVRPAIGVTRFSRPEKAGMDGGPSSDLKMMASVCMCVCVCVRERGGGRREREREWSKYAITLCTLLYFNH